MKLEKDVKNIIKRKFQILIKIFKQTFIKNIS